MKFIHIHASGRFDRSPESLESALDSYMSLGASLITLTEVSGKPRSSRLAEKGWGHVQSSAGGRKSDSAILYKKSDWDFEYADYSLVVPGDGAGILPVWAVIAVMHHKSGKIIVVSSAHMPRSVEGKGGFISDRKRVMATVSGARNWRKATNTVAKHEGADAILMAADWNLNVKQTWVQKWFSKTFPNFRTNWRGKLPARGTLGKRIIDIGLLKNLKVVKAPKILKHNSSSDHTAYVETLDFK